MHLYPARALERAMKIKEVLTRAMSGQITWMQAAEIIGISDPSMRRWRARLEKHGYDGLYDRRMRRPSPKRVPLATVEKVLRLHREVYYDLNVKHFVEKLHQEHDIDLSYTWVKTALQTAGLVKRYPKRGQHRKRRPSPALTRFLETRRRCPLSATLSADIQRKFLLKETSGARITHETSDGMTSARLVQSLNSNVSPVAVLPRTRRSDNRIPPQKSGSRKPSSAVKTSYGNRRRSYRTLGYSNTGV